MKAAISVPEWPTLVEPLPTAARESLLLRHELAAHPQLAASSWGPLIRPIAHHLVLQSDPSHHPTRPAPPANHRSMPRTQATGRGGGQGRSSTRAAAAPTSARRPGPSSSAISTTTGLSRKRARGNDNGHHHDGWSDNDHAGSDPGDEADEYDPRSPAWPAASSALWHMSSLPSPPPPPLIAPSYPDWWAGGGSIISPVERQFLDPMSGDQGGRLLSDAAYTDLRNHFLATQDPSVTRALAAAAAAATNHWESSLPSAASVMTVAAFLELHGLLRPETLPVADFASLSIWPPDTDRTVADPTLGVEPELVCATCAAVPHPVVYRSVLVADTALCPRCFTAGEFSGAYSGSYVAVRLDTSAVTGTPSLSKKSRSDDHNEEWPLDETVRLLDAVSAYSPPGDLAAWDAVAQYVGSGRTAGQCFAHFLALGAEDPERPTLDPSNSKDDPPAAEVVPFADAPNPAAALAHFLAANVNGSLAAKFAQAALAQLLADGDDADDDNSALQKPPAPVDLKAALAAAGSTAHDLALAEHAYYVKLVLGVVELVMRRTDKKIKSLDRLATEIERTAADAVAQVFIASDPSI
ncbi:hypothetical protein BC828DRAFT_393521 [Blastocladiella britannica]|nr:hypothetical protein BC828DRAFT_393521 [Blastocladiella britannica]